MRTVRTLLLVLTAVAAAGPLADDRLRLTLDREGPGQLRLDWQDSCPRAGTDYAVHEGSLGSFDSHTSVQCSTVGATSTAVTPAASSSYFLIVPLDEGAEGSYGVDSAGNERSVGLGTCLPQQVLRSCLPDTFLSADPARVARLDAVLAAAGAILQGGGSYTEVAAMLAAESDVSNVSSNGVSLFFTVDGLPTSIYDTEVARHGAPLREVIPPAEGSRAPAPPPASAPARQSSAGPQPASAVASMLPRGQRMVGEDDDGDGRRDLPKYARVLSPWAFDFAPSDSAPRVRDILNAIPDYQGNVAYRENVQDLVADSMSLSDYMDGWDDLDIIFVSSHADAGPDADWGPDPHVFLGIGGTACSASRARLLAERPDAGSIPGLHCSVFINIGPEDNVIVGVDTIATAAFWTHAHGGNLRKKLIYFDACRTTLLPGLAESLTGPDSIFLGWSELVGPAASLSSAEAILRDSVEDGFPVLRSFVRQCGAGQCVDTDPDTELRAHWDRADLRTRDALTIPAAPTLGVCAVSSTQPLSLTCPSCGSGVENGLSTTFSFVVEGVRPEEMVFIQDPLEFGKYQLRLFADVDDVESGYAQPLTDLNTVPVGDGAYADLFPVTLAIQDACPYEILEYRPWVLLPAFDEQMPGNDGRDRMYGWDGVFTIEVEPLILP